jgi:hypothetical protein
LHWADKQKPLQEVAREFGVFPETVSPPLVPEAIDENEEAPIAAAEVTDSAVAARLIERVKVTEHFLAVEHVPVRTPERRMTPRGMPAFAA